MKLNLIHEAYRMLYEESRYHASTQNPPTVARGIEDIVFLTKRFAEAEWNTRIDAEKKRLKPKGKRKANVEVSDEFLSALRVELLAKYNIEAIETRREHIRKARKALMLDLLGELDFTPDPECWHRVQVSSAYGYGSQTQPELYAKGSLYPLMDQLHRLGFETHLRFANNNHELWANCPPWLADAADRKTTIIDAIRSWKGRSVNPHVYWPLLSHNIADRVPWGAAALQGT